MPIWVVWFIYDFKLAFLLDVEWLLSRLRTQHIYATQLKAIKELLDTSFDELLK